MLYTFYVCIGSRPLFWGFRFNRIFIEFPSPGKLGVTQCSQNVLTESTDPLTSFHWPKPLRSEWKTIILPLGLLVSLERISQWKVRTSLWPAHLVTALFPWKVKDCWSTQTSKIQHGWLIRTNLHELFHFLCCLYFSKAITQVVAILFKYLLIYVT